MLGKLKKILGIEGVKINLLVPQKIDLEKEMISGTVVLTSIRKDIVEKIRVKLTEKYTRGRRSAKKTDEYVIGEIELIGPFEVMANEEKTIEFELRFLNAKSEMDKMEDDNIASKLFAKFAKWTKGVKSTYHMDAEAFVKGTKLNPVSSIELLE